MLGYGTIGSRSREPRFISAKSGINMSDTENNALIQLNDDDQPEEQDSAPINPRLLVNPNALIRVENGDRNQCQAVHADFQCPYRALGTRKDDGTWIGASMCSRHAAGHNHIEDQRNLRLFRIVQWQDQINHQADHPKIKNLREEIGILRMTLQSKLETINTPMDLAMRSQSVGQLIREIRETIIAAHKLEISLGQLLDKSQAMELVNVLAQCVAQNVGDESIRQQISLDMVMSLEKFFH